uniref:Ig-like domain-containing protein n=1 Tax=Pygocentrus nattereri TaxID=42514 RepID=A0A3B4EHK9_PYGNA
MQRTLYSSKRFFNCSWFYIEPLSLSQVVLTQSERPVTVTPGGSHKLTCACSGFAVGSYNMYWIRQPAGKALEWIGVIDSSGGTAYSDKLKSKFSISRDTGTNTITLRGQNLQTEDTAVYYCARYTVTLTNEHGLQKPRADTQYN